MSFIRTLVTTFCTEKKSDAKTERAAVIKVGVVAWISFSGSEAATTVLNEKYTYLLRHIFVPDEGGK